MNAFIEKVLNIWMAGGWTMIPLAVLGLMTYGAAVRLFLYFRRRDFQNVSQETWMQWLRDPQKGRGEVGEIIRYAHEDIQGEEDIRSRFAEVALSKIPSHFSAFFFSKTYLSRALIARLPPNTFSDFTSLKWFA